MFSNSQQQWTSRKLGGRIRVPKEDDLSNIWHTDPLTSDLCSLTRPCQTRPPEDGNYQTKNSLPLVKDRSLDSSTTVTREALASRGDDGVARRLPKHFDVASQASWASSHTSWASAESLGSVSSTNSISKRNKQARYHVPIAKRPSERLLLNARRHVLEGRAFRGGARKLASLSSTGDVHDSKRQHQSRATTISYETQPRRDLVKDKTMIGSEKPSDETAGTQSIEDIGIMRPRKTMYNEDGTMRRFVSEMINSRIQSIATHRIDWRSRKPLVNPRDIFSDARAAARDREVASAVAQAAMKALEQLKRHETNVRRSRLRSSTVGQHLAMQAQMAQLLAMRRQHHERDQKRQCAQTIARWCNCERNDERLVAEGAVDAAARLALEDDDNTRKFSAISLRTLATRPPFRDALLQPHVLSTFRELLSEDADEEDASTASGGVVSAASEPFTSRGSQRGGLAAAAAGGILKSRVLRKHTNAVHAVPRDAALALIRLTAVEHDAKFAADGLRWEGRLVEKGVHLLLLNAAERHAGMAEGVACALFNLTCAEDIYPQMERVTRALVQMPSIQADAKVRSIVARALRNIATHPALVLRMIEEGVVQRVGQLAAAALMELQATAFRHNVELSDLPDHIDEDDIVRECCISILLRFAHNPVVRIDMIHAGGPRAIFALLRRPVSTRSSVARVAGRAATTLALLSEAPGAHDILERDRSARTLALAVQSTMANGPTGKVPASMRAAMQGTRAASMWASAAAGRASLARTYTKKERREHSRDVNGSECGSCAAHDLLHACLGDGANPATCRSFVRRVDEARHDKALRFALLTLALLLSDTTHGVALLASAVRSGALTTVVQMCCHHKVNLPTGLWNFQEDRIPTSSNLDGDDLRGRRRGSLRPCDAFLPRQIPNAKHHTEARAPRHQKSSQRQASPRLQSFDVTPNEMNAAGHVGILNNPNLPSEMPLNKALIGACALVFERVTAFQLVREDDAVSRALVPGIVRLAQRVKELIANGWVTVAYGAPNMDSPPWCLSCCVTALGRLAIDESALVPARISTAAGTMAILVDTLRLHMSTVNPISASDVHYVNLGMRALVALRDIALEPGVIEEVTRIVIPAALLWYETVDVGARAAAASLFTVLSFDKSCRRSLLEHDILRMLLEVTLRSNRKSEERIVVSFDSFPPSRDGGDFARNEIGAGELSKPPRAREFVAQSRLCCAITLANLSLEPRARRAMVFSKAAQALGLLSDTSYGEDNQLACAHALCNICSTVAEDGDDEVVRALQNQRVVAAVSMIGAVRASHDTTRRSCAAALANLLAPRGYLQAMETALADMNAQGLMPTLVRMCRVDDVQTRAYAACALARISATSAGRALLTSRPICLRVLFARTNKQFGWNSTSVATFSANSTDALTKGRLSGQRRGKSWHSRDDGHSGTLDMLRHSVARIACRLILATSDCCAVAVDVGALAFVIGIVYTQPSDVELNGETKSCITAIECCSRQSIYRMKLAADPRTLTALAIFTLERNQPKVSLSAQVSIGLLAWDLDTRAAVARSDSVVCSLVSVAVDHARENYVPHEAVAIARALLCLVLVPNSCCDWIQVVKLGVLTALLLLEIRRGQETLQIDEIDDDDDAAMRANFELSTIAMYALRVIAERGAGSPDIALRLRNEDAIDIAAAVAAPKRATLMKKPDGGKGVAFWRYSAFIHSYAALYAFARYHEVLRQKLDGPVVAAIHTVSSGLVRCEETSDVLRGWSVATLALLLVDPLQRNRLATQFNMLVELIQIARIELQRRKPSDNDGEAQSLIDENNSHLPHPISSVIKAEKRMDTAASLRPAANPMACDGACIDTSRSEDTVKESLGTASPHRGVDTISAQPSRTENIRTDDLPLREGVHPSSVFSTVHRQSMVQVSSKHQAPKRLDQVTRQERDLLRDPALAVQHGTAEKNIVWCFFQLSKVEKKKTREVLQDATELIAQLSRRKTIKEKVWLVAATTEAHRLLARRQYESNLITKSGTLSLLVRHSFRGGSDETESAMNASLKMLEDFNRLADALQPTGDHVPQNADLPIVERTRGRDDGTVGSVDLDDVPHESNDFFLSDGGGRGPRIQELALSERMDQPQNGNGMTDLESNLSDDDDDILWVERDPKKNDSVIQCRSSVHRHATHRKIPHEIGSKERGNLVNPWFIKMEVPKKLLEASKFDECALLDNSFEENTSEEDSSGSDSGASERSTDSESDYANFKFVERTEIAKRKAVFAEKTILEENWEPSHYEKFPDQVEFLADQLHRIFFLKTLTRKETRLIINAMRPSYISAGEQLVTQGVPSGTFYIVAQGRCIVSTQNRGKIGDIPNQDHSDQQPECFIRELALLHDHECDASVTALTDVEVFSLERKIFKRVLANAASTQRTLYAEFVDKVPLFQEMSINQKHVICDALEPVDFSAGDIIVHEGEDGDDFFIVEQGTVECLKLVKGEQQRVCPPLGASAFFGELALLRNAPRSATVRALEDVSVLRIDRDTFDRTIGQIEAIHKDYDDELCTNDETKLLDSLRSRKHNRKKRRSKVTLVDGTESDSSDDESDYADFEFITSNRNPAKRIAVTADRVLLEDNWAPPHYKKTSKQTLFLTDNLGRLFFMSQLTRKERRLLVDAMYAKTFEPGVKFITQGDKGDLFYIVEDGNCVVSIDGVGKVMDIPDYAGNEYSRGPARRHIGELALLYERPRGANVTALNEVTAWCLDRTTFKAILQNSSSKQRLLYANFISKVPLFKNLDTATKNIICDALRPQDYDAGDEIIVEGDDGDEFFILEQGTVECLKTVEEEQVRVCPPLKAGTFFGELALLRNAPRAATVKALEDVSVVKIDRATFLRCIGHLEGLHANYEVDSVSSAQSATLGKAEVADGTQTQTKGFKARRLSSFHPSTHRRCRRRASHVLGNSLQHVNTNRRLSNMPNTSALPLGISSNRQQQRLMGSSPAAAPRLPKSHSFKATALPVGFQKSNRFDIHGSFP